MGIVFVSTSRVGIERRCQSGGSGLGVPYALPQTEMRAILIEGNPSAAERVKETFASGGDSRARTHSPLELIKPLAHLWGLCRRILPRDPLQRRPPARQLDRKSTRLNSSHLGIS